MIYNLPFDIIQLREGKNRKEKNMKPITKKDVDRVKKNLEEAKNAYNNTKSNKDLKRVTFLEAALRRYKKAWLHTALDAAK